MMFIRFNNQLKGLRPIVAVAARGRALRGGIIRLLFLIAGLGAGSAGISQAQNIQKFEPRMEARILKNSATQKCLQIARFSTFRSGQQAVTAQCTHAANTDGVLGETWVIERAGTRDWRIKARRDDWCLAVEQNIDDQAGMPVVWRPCNSHSNQAWRFVDVLEGDHPARQLKNSLTGRCVTASSNDRYPQLYAARCGESALQLWDPSPVRVAAALLGRGAVALNLNDPKFSGVDRVNVRVGADGSAIGFGDIVLGNVEGGNIVVQQPPPLVYSPYRAAAPCAETAAGVGVACSELSTDRDTRLWAGGVIPYSFSYCGANDSLEIGRRVIDPENPDEVRTSAGVVRNAIAYLEEHTVLEFREQAGANDRADRDPPNILVLCYGNLSAGIAGQSAVGFTGQRNQAVSFARPEDLGFGNDFNLVSERTVYHEMLHAIGFIHEHQRADRDQYITINFDNLPNSDLIRDNFGAKTDSRSITPYDVRSVMHYTNRSALALDPSVSTFFRRNNPTGGVFGSEQPADRDIDGINLLYADEADRALPDLRGHRTMTLTINNISSDDTDGDRGRKVAIDFYTKVEMGAGWGWRPFSSVNTTDNYTSGQIEESDNNVSPDWTFDTLLPANQAQGKIVMRIRDDDGVWGDEDVDISPYPDQKYIEVHASTVLDGVYLAAPNGDFDLNGRLGGFGVPLSVREGTEGDIKGQIVFTVDISEAP